MVFLTIMIISMKKGQIVGVAKKVPENSRFRAYKDIKRHWKNMVRIFKNQTCLCYIHILLVNFRKFARKKRLYHLGTAEMFRLDNLSV